MKVPLSTVVLFALAFALTEAQTKPAHWKSAPTPPMGWNSWDIFGTTVTEEQTMAQADAMAKYLKPAGWRTGVAPRISAASGGGRWNLITRISLNWGSPVIILSAIYGSRETLA